MEHMLVENWSQQVMCTIVSHVAAEVQTTGFCILYMSIDGIICIHTQIS